MSKFKLLYSGVDYLTKLVSSMTDPTYFSAKLQVFKMMLKETACLSTHKTVTELGFCPCLLLPRQHFQIMVWAVPVSTTMSVRSFSL